VRPNQRHLLLMAQDRTTKVKDKLLCGHDERHWFIATIPDGQSVASVQDAMNALRPEQAIHSLKMQGVKTKHRNRRRNRGYIRQGEWFFIPTAAPAPK